MQEVFYRTVHVGNARAATWRKSANRSSMLRDEMRKRLADCPFSSGRVERVELDVGRAQQRSKV